MSTSKAKSTPRQSARKSKEKRPSTDELVLQLMQKVDDNQSKNDKRFEALKQQKAPTVVGNAEAWWSAINVLRMLLKNRVATFH